MPTVADNNPMMNRLSAAWVVLAAIPILSALVGFTLVVVGFVLHSSQLVQCGMIAAVPSATLALVFVVSALALLAYRVYSAVAGPENVEVAEDPDDVYVSADEIVAPPVTAETNLPVPLELAPRIPRPILHSKLRDSKWFKHLPELCSVPAEHRVWVEFVSRACFRLGMPRDLESWTYNAFWFNAYVPEILQDRRLHYLVLDLGGMSDTTRQRTISFLWYLSTYQSDAGHLRLYNVSRDVVLELERRNVPHKVVDSHWVDEQRIADESSVLCAPQL